MFAKFHHFTPNNKKVMMRGRGVHFVPPSPGCDEPKKPGLDRAKLFLFLSIRKKQQQ